ncbi:MAG: hypothetical protein ACLVB1_13720 [Blautia obeum]
MSIELIRNVGRGKCRCLSGSLIVMEDKSRDGIRKLLGMPPVSRSAGAILLPGCRHRRHGK